MVIDAASFLAQDYWVVLWRPAAQTTAAEVAEHLDDHLAWMLDLERAGHVMASGPFLEGPGVVPGAGLTVLRVADAAAATDLARQDPFVIAGLRGFDVLRWRLMEGALTVRLSFGTSTYRLD
jgi:uncharacterized protein YciI